MRKLNGKALRMYLTCCQGILLFSAAVDFLLWMLTGYKVPSWTLSSLTVGFVAMIWVVMRVAIDFD